MIQFPKNYLTNNSQIETLPYEVLEEIVKQIIPKNILPENLPVSFEAVKSLSHTNKKMHLFIHSNRIHRHVVDVVLKHMNETLLQQEDGQFSIRFLRWYIISNQLDQFLDHFYKTQRIVNSVLNKKTFVYGRETHTMRYYKKNLVRYQVGNTRKIKTGLIASFFSFKEGVVDILYPLGELRIVDVDISTVEALIKRLKVTFEGIFEKHKCLQNGIVEDITQKPEESNLFEFVEHTDLCTPYYELSIRNRQGAFRINKFDSLRYINNKKGRKKLIFCDNPFLFSCYRMDHAYPEIVHRNTGDREKELLSEIVRGYFHITMGCSSKKEPFASYLEYIDAYLYPCSATIGDSSSLWDSSSEASESN